MTSVLAASLKLPDWSCSNRFACAASCESMTDWPDLRKSFGETWLNAGTLRSAVGAATKDVCPKQYSTMAAGKVMYTAIARLVGMRKFCMLADPFVLSIYLFIGLND